MPVFGLDIFQYTASSPRANSGSFSQIMIICTPGGSNASNHNNPIGIISLPRFQALYPSASSSVLEAVRDCFVNNPQVVLSVFAGSDTTATTGDEAETVAHLNKGIEEAGNRNSLGLRIVIIPEMQGLTQANRTAIYTAMHNVAVKREWILFAGSSDSATTTADFIAERNQYSSTLGHAAYYAGRYTNSNDVDVSYAPVSAAIAVRRNLEEGGYKPPAGTRYPLLGIKKMVNPIRATADLTQLRDNNINFAYDTPRSGICIWGARTLSKDDNFLHINTRFAASVAVSRIEAGLLDLLFESFDPQGFLSREIDRRLTSILSVLFQEGALGGANVGQAFRLQREIVPSDTSPGDEDLSLQQLQSSTTRKRKIIRRIFVNFVGAAEAIEVRIYHTDQIDSLNLGVAA